jgi:hypothetical protein
MYTDNRLYLESLARIKCDFCSCSALEKILHKYRFNDNVLCGLCIEKTIYDKKYFLPLLEYDYSLIRPKT